MVENLHELLRGRDTDASVVLGLLDESGGGTRGAGEYIVCLQCSHL